ncbi:S41 family peptidase [Cellulophaga baltica]|uniref:S41 family peptidase n=1 Tax=Cellulophaga TaxID=104264 RepID=UPI001C068E3B|nr:MULTISPECIES: S41 family peptidase [Cellulophaga]MBU2995177.1 S41 family peptidase [Cellulophaga baltica]MDO6766572.1 S41 family peptidase [Cellulophaga sp. 1_MG-2023]
MNRFFCFFMLTVFFSSCVSVKKYNEDIAATHSVSDLRNDIDIAYTKLKKLHPKLYQFINKEKLNFKFDSLKQTINAPLTSREFYKKIAPVISEVRQGHISVFNPSKKYTKKEYKALREKKFEFYEFDFENVGDAFLVKQNRGLDSTLVGAQILKINNEPITNLIADYQNFFSSDGYNQSFKDRFVALRFSSFYFKDKGYLDSLSITFKQHDSVFSRMFRRIPKDSVLSKIDSLKNEEIVKLSRDQKRAKKHASKYKRKYNLKHGYIPLKKTYTRNFRFIGIDSSVAYIKISNFNNGPYEKFYKETFQKIKASNTQNLILDLRDNTGGRLDEIVSLYRYLTTDTNKFVEKAQTKTRIPFNKSFISKGKPAFMNFMAVLASPISIPIEWLKTSKKDGVIYYKVSGTKKAKKVNPLHYSGAIYVLINGNSFSASAILATNLKATERAFFVGEETGGHYNGTVAGVQKYILLPESKVSFHFGLMQIETPYQKPENGYGVFPDVQIIPTKKDREQGVDPELKWVLDHIEK